MASEVEGRYAGAREPDVFGDPLRDHLQREVLRFAIVSRVGQCDVCRGMGCGIDVVGTRLEEWHRAGGEDRPAFFLVCGPECGSRVAAGARKVNAAHAGEDGGTVVLAEAWEVVGRGKVAHWAREADRG